MGEKSGFVLVVVSPAVNMYVCARETTQAQISEMLRRVIIIIVIFSPTGSFYEAGLVASVSIRPIEEKRRLKKLSFSCSIGGNERESEKKKEKEEK